MLQAVLLELECSISMELCFLFFLLLLRHITNSRMLAVRSRKTRAAMTEMIVIAIGFIPFLLFDCELVVAHEIFEFTVVVMVGIESVSAGEEGVAVGEEGVTVGEEGVSAGEEGV